MAASSPSFAQACEYLKLWLEGIVDADPDIGPPGRVAVGSEVCIAPWRIGSPLRERERGNERLTATGYFCVSIGPAAPELGCTWLDTIYFAAFGSTEVALSPVDPPERYWTASPGLHVTLTRRIERPVDALRPGRVERPLVFDIRTDPARVAAGRS